MSEEVLKVRQHFNQSQQSLSQVRSLLNHDFRVLFGALIADGCGHFVESHLSKTIHQFSDWVSYPSGDHWLDSHTSTVWSVCVSDDGCWLFSGSSEKIICIHDLRDNAETQRWKAHDSSVTSLCFHKGRLASGSFDSHLKLWDAPTFELTHTMKGHSKLIRSLCFDRNGEQLLSASDDTTLRLWNVDTAECLRVFRGHTSLVMVCSIIDGALVSGSLDYSVRVWDSDTGNEKRVIKEGINGTVCDFSWSSDLSTLAVALVHHCELFEWPSMRGIGQIRPCRARCAFHPRNPDILAVSNDDDGLIKVYHVSNGECIAAFKGHSDSVYSLRFVPDGYRLISSSIDKSIRIWDVSELI